jgi:hypothetical protein
MGGTFASPARNEGLKMPNDDITQDRMRRALYLVSVGIHSSVIRAALERSSDGENLGALLGFIEDILDLGCTISDPE